MLARGKARVNRGTDRRPAGEKTSIDYRYVSREVEPRLLDGGTGYWRRRGGVGSGISIFPPGTRAGNHMAAKE